MKKIFSTLSSILRVSLAAPLALSAIALTACATNEDGVRFAGAEKEIVTGSNIPRKDKSIILVKTVSKAELEKLQNTGGTGEAATGSK